MVAEVQARSAGRIVGSSRSRPDGTYRLELAAGTYTLVAATPQPFPRCVARTVTVAAAQTTVAPLMCDTGIR